MNPWIEYQPQREREKLLYDIELRDGTILTQCYPNGISWNANIFGQNPTVNRSIEDYRVVRIRLSEKQIEDL